MYKLETQSNWKKLQTQALLDMVKPSFYIDNETLSMQLSEVEEK